MLQGSIDTLGVAEVLRVLASTHKTGQLRLNGDRGAGSVTVADGQMVAADSAQCPAGEPLDAIVFDLLRFEQGQFVFSPDHVPTEGERHEIEAVLGGALGRLEDYRHIASVVPSLDHLVAPVDHLSADRIEISNDEWVLLRTIGDGSPVSEVGRVLDLGEVDALRSVKNLVERDLAIVAAPDPESFAADLAEDPIDVAVDVPAVPGFDAPLSKPEESGWPTATDTPAPEVDMIGDDPMAEAALSAAETAAALDMATSVPAPTAVPGAGFGTDTPAESLAEPAAEATGFDTDAATDEAMSAASFAADPADGFPSAETIAADPAPGFGTTTDLDAGAGETTLGAQVAEVAAMPDAPAADEAPSGPTGFRPPAPPPPPAASPESYQNARLEGVAAADVAPAPPADGAAFDAELPPSPSEIESFGVGVADAAPLTDAAPDAATEAAGFIDPANLSMDADEVGAEAPAAEATPPMEEAEDDHALLMRYLRAEG